MKTYPKKVKKAYEPRFKSDGSVNLASSNYAQPTTQQRDQLNASNIPCAWTNADGTKNHEAYNDFLEEREKAAWNSKSF